MNMQQKKSQKILRIVEGILFALLIIPVAYLMLIGIFELSNFIKAKISSFIITATYNHNSFIPYHYNCNLESKHWW